MLTTEWFKSNWSPSRFFSSNQNWSAEWKHQKCITERFVVDCSLEYLSKLQRHSLGRSFAFQMTSLWFKSLRLFFEISGITGRFLERRQHFIRNILVQIYTNLSVSSAVILIVQSCRKLLKPNQCKWCPKKVTRLSHLKTAQKSVNCPSRRSSDGLDAKLHQPECFRVSTVNEGRLSTRR